MMDKKMKTLVFLFLVVPMVLSGQTVSKTNFSGVVGAGARAFGMGGTFIAIADDATSASWNPGGLGQLESPELTFVFKFQNYREMNPASGDGRTSFAGPEDLLGTSYGFDFLSFTYPIRIGNFKIVPQISYQRAISYNLELKANDVQFFSHDVLRNLQIPIEKEGTESETQTYKGGLDVVSLSLGSRLFDRLCVGVSANFWLNGYEGEFKSSSSGEWSALDDSDLEGDWISDFTNREEVDIRGVNFNLGVLVDLTDKFKVGAVYKSSFKADASYRVSSKLKESFGDSGGMPLNQEETEVGKSPLRWPETFGVGVSYRPIDPLTISLDFTQTRWSRAILEDFPIYDEDIGFIGRMDVYFPTLEPVVNDEDFEQLDTRQFRLGLEYVLIGKRTLIPLRLGFFIDSQYYPDASGTQVVFFGFTGGFGIKRGGFNIDAAALLETGSYLDDKDSYGATSFTEIKVYLSTSYSF